MIISLREFTSWVDTSIFELWVTCVSILLTSMLLVAKLHDWWTITFSYVFMPIFVGLGINFYFIFIVLVRTCVEYKDYKSPVTKFLFNSIRQALCALFTVLLVTKIGGEFDTKEVAVRMSYGFVFLPIWILMAILAVQVCRSTSN